MSKQMNFELEYSGEVAMDELDNSEHQDINFFTPSRSLHSKKTTFITPSKSRPLTKINFSSDIDVSREHQTISISKSGNDPNRSARKKSIRALIERTRLGNISEENEEDEELAEQIFDTDEVDDQANHAEDFMNLYTPRRAQKFGSKKDKNDATGLDNSAQELTAHGNYFMSNKGGYPKTSNSTLASLELLEHEEYFSRYYHIKGNFEDDMKNLEQIYLDKFDQWQFELSQDFNLCLYGFGSKRSLLMQFAEYLSTTQKYRKKAKIVVVNGHVNTLTIRDILKTISSALTTEIIKSSSPSDMLNTVFGLLDKDEELDITLLIHSIDGRPLRRLANQDILSRFSSHPQVHLVATADHPMFPLLWDSSLRSLYNFLFYDCTTFQSYNAEVDAVTEVNDILGRSGRRLGGKDGVTFVLRSLPDNAKKLFGVLIREQLKVMADFSNSFDKYQDSVSQKPRHHENEFGIEYRVLYQKAVEEFICSNEINFRTLLKEFNDHQMIQSKKDALGTELLSIPFRQDELEAILEDIVF